MVDAKKEILFWEEVPQCFRFPLILVVCVYGLWADMVQNYPHAICHPHHNDHHRPYAKAVSGSGGCSELVPPINLWRLHSAVRALFCIRLAFQEN